MATEKAERIKCEIEKREEIKKHVGVELLQEKKEKI